ncbi:MAG: transposase [Bacteroidota bacterium]|nr:transposase [Bacteroidota bacterium]
MVADAYFSKKPFVDKVLEAKMHFISWHRDDSMLMYKHYGSPTGKRGRPKKFEGRVNINDLDATIFVVEVCNDDLIIYAAPVYSKAFKRDIRTCCGIIS